MRATLSLLLAALLVASAQQTVTPPAAPAGTNKKAFSFSTNVQLVVIDAFIKDKGGRPIPNLTAADFTVSEDGKPQDVAVCQFQELQSEPESPLPATLSPRPDDPKPEVKAAAKAQIAPAAAGEVKYRDKRLLVLFFDMTSMPIQDQVRAQDSATKFVRTQITSSDLLAIMSFSGDVKVVEDFTADRDKLIKDIKNLTIGEGQGFGITATGDSTTDTGSAFSADDSEFNIFNTDRQLSALETAVTMLGSLPEKKALVYFNSGITESGTDNQAQMTATVNAAIKNNVSFYPIDARGLVASAPLGDATTASSTSSGARTGAANRSNQANFQATQESISALADDTGGKALLDNSDLAAGIVQAQKDISSYYIIGYYSKNANLDGKYRRIDLKLKKDLSAKLDYRHGYFAGKQWGKLSGDDRERQLAEALMLGDPVTDIEVAVEIDYFRLSKDSYFVPVEVKIPGSELELARRGGAEIARLDFIGQVKDAKGELTGGGNVRDYVELKLKGEQAAELTRRPVAYGTGFTLKPGAYTLKFLVRENETGKMGTFQQKFVVPDLTGGLAMLPTSSVILSAERQPVNAALYTAEKDKKLLAENPLVLDNQQLIPSVTRVFRKDKDMYVYLEAYEPAADAAQPITAYVGFYRGKQMVFQTEPLVVKDGLNLKSKALPVRFILPLNKLQAGRYDCQVSVLNPSTQQWSFTRSPIMVVP
jgi:VWFA-related protein